MLEKYLKKKKKTRKEKKKIINMITKVNNRCLVKVQLML